MTETVFGTDGLIGVLGAADSLWSFLGQFGEVLALGLAALGSAIGIGLAGRSASGAWGKEGKAGRNLSFTYIILLGMPISQTLYAMIVMNNLAEYVSNASSELLVANSGLLFGIGLATGIGELFSAWMQGMIGAAGIRALSEGEGKGFAFIIIAMGVVETVGIFAMVFMLGVIPELPAAAETAASLISATPFG